MKPEDYVQFTVEEVFTPIFQYERKILEGGKFLYVEVDRTPRTTGIHIFDAILRCLEARQYTIAGIARTLGVNKRDLSGLLRLLTGRPAHEFIAAYEMHTVRLLLRYTNMTTREIVNYCGLGTIANLAQRLKETYGETVNQLRYKHRQKYDLGRFVLRMPGEK